MFPTINIDPICLYILHQSGGHTGNNSSVFCVKFVCVYFFRKIKCSNKGKMELNFHVFSHKLYFLTFLITIFTKELDGHLTFFL